MRINVSPNGTPTSFTGYIPKQSGNPTHDLEHIPEIQRMINESINQQVPPMIKKCCEDTVRAMIGAIEYDVKTCVDISFEDGGDIFYSEKARKFVSDHITNELISRLDNMDIEIHI